MPPRMNKACIKGSLASHASSSHALAPPPSPMNATYPWPRLEKTQIDILDPRIPEYSTEAWTKEHSRMYNAFLNMTIAPTRTLHSGVLNTLGLDEDAHAMLSAIGLSELCLKEHPLYPDLVRQCLASCEITYDDPEQPSLDTAYFSFFASGKKHTLSLDDFNGVYVIDSDSKDLHFPKKFAPTQKFWELIANGEYKSRSAYQSGIRNPRLRIVAKTLSHLLFAKETTANVSNRELQLLYARVRDEILAAKARIPQAKPKTNPGFVLAQMFVEKKTRILPKGGKGLTERCGSMLTPLFEHLSLDLAAYKVNATPEFIDITYWIHCGILKDKQTFNFYGRDGTSVFCSLPQPDITGLNIWENIEFLPAPEHLCPDPRAATFDANMDDVEDATLVDEYDLGPLADDADIDTYRRWMVASQCKNNSLMKRILCTVIGGYFQTPIKMEGTSRGAQGVPSPAEERRGRNRRYAGQSDSEETD